MILEELVGALVALGSSLIIQTPSLSRQCRPTYDWLVFEDSREDEEGYEDLIHREYEEGETQEISYYETVDIPVLNTATRARPSICESFRRSVHVNIGLLLAVVLLGLATIGLVYLDLNTTSNCIEWRHFNHSIPASVNVLQTIGACMAVVPVYLWFPISAAMLWGLKEFKKSYLSCLYAAFLMTAMAVVYKAVFPDQYRSDTSIKLRLPANSLFVFTIFLTTFLTARKFKQVNPTTRISLCDVFFCLSFTFIAGTVLSYIYTYIIIEYFKETQNKIKKAMFAALTPGLVLLPTAIGKYLVLRRSSEIIRADKSFLLCFFLRGGAIVLYRTMQSDFQNIWLFIGLSLLHGVSNVLSKLTLNLRIKMWKCFVACVNKTHCTCGSRLELLSVDTPRMRRLNADLEIQNILFEYTTVILSQAYLVLYLVMNFEVSAWQVIQGSLMRICISTAMDFVFNVISVFIQVHVYDIPMRRVWFKYWCRHVVANALIIVVMISNFGASLVSVFAARQDRSLQYELRNCTSLL